MSMLPRLRMTLLVPVVVILRAYIDEAPWDRPGSILKSKYGCAIYVATCGGGLKSIDLCRKWVYV